MHYIRNIAVVIATVIVCLAGCGCVKNQQSEAQHPVQSSTPVQEKVYTSEEVREILKKDFLPRVEARMKEMELKYTPYEFSTVFTWGEDGKPELCLAADCTLEWKGQYGPHIDWRQFRVIVNADVLDICESLYVGADYHGNLPDFKRVYFWVESQPVW